MDSRLRWDYHRERMEAKATERLTALSALASSTWGTGLISLRQVYKAMVVPQMLYGCSAWHTQGGRGRAMTNAIARIQRRAGQIITGAFRTTAAAAVDVEAHLLPVPQQIEQTAIEATMRIRTTPLLGEMEARSNDKAESPLDRLSGVLQRKHHIPLDKLERRQQHIVPPWWTPPDIYIAKTRADATDEHDAIDEGTIRVYADGSSVKGRVAAAAVMPTQEEDVWTKKTEYMGKATTSNVYAAELRGIELAFQLVLDHHATTHNPGKCVVFSDNRAAIRAMANPRSSSGQYILAEALRALDKLRDLGWEIQIRWIPAHEKMLGNDIADETAKEATGYIVATRTTLEPPPEPENVQVMTATTKPIIRQAMKNEWLQSWMTGKHGRELFNLGVRPNKGILKTHKGTHRAISSVITQMRTAKIGLRAYLYAIDKTETDQCQCGMGRQTVRHILLECRDWAEEREKMWAGEASCEDVKKILCDPSLVVQAAKMMIRTGLLEQFRAVPSTVLNYS